MSFQEAEVGWVGNTVKARVARRLCNCARERIRVATRQEEHVHREIKTFKLGDPIVFLQQDRQIKQPEFSGC